MDFKEIVSKVALPFSKKVFDEHDKAKIFKFKIKNNKIDVEEEEILLNFGIKDDINKYNELLCKDYNQIYFCDTFDLSGGDFIDEIFKLQVENVKFEEYNFFDEYKDMITLKIYTFKDYQIVETNYDYGNCSFFMSTY
jgi:hypothetical protein